MNKENPINEIKVSEIFDNSQYMVPIYQRNYAWENDEIKQLIDDINDAITQDNKKYFLGTLIVNKRKNGIFEVIDGQQRLTTLYLIKKYIDANFDPNADKLQFEAREKYKRTFQAQDLNNLNNNNNYYAQEIISGYGNIKNNLKNEEKEEFKRKLENVYLVRVQVPKNIDLNHYFEIMNTRGEQLEPHEIIKAKILGKLKGQEEKVIAAEIWEKCSDMSTYIQMKFDKIEVRKKLFGEDWNTLVFKGFEDIIASYKEEINEKNNSDDENLKNNENLESVIKFAKNHPEYPQDNKNSKKQKEDIEKERFESIISFPNFLLQVNAIINENIDNNEDGFLDDKNFLDKMKKNYEDKNKDQAQEKAKSFIYNLLKYRFLFDKYVLKRDFSKNKNEGEWSLKKIKVYKNTDFNYVNTFRKDENSQDENEEETNFSKQLKMLQATLRITYTSPKTMKWIAILLKFAEERQLSTSNKCKQQPNCAGLIEKLENYCRKAIKQNNYDINHAYQTMDRIVFSYLDYLLYKNGYDGIISPYASDWKCIYRNSIEHFSPQTGGDFENEENILHSFGNLVLITVAGNSKFSNMKPEQKICEENIINQSLKLKIMKELISKSNGKKWTKELIEQHQEKMLEILEKDIRK